MGSGKNSRSAASKISTATTPAASASTQSTSRSSIIRSSFAPSHFQLALFASVIQGFDSQRLRFHDTTTGRLRCEHAIAPKATISCLDWGYYSHEYPERHRNDLKEKKRKRSEQVNGATATNNAQDVVLAFGTSDSEIHLFSPATATIAGVLRGVHTQGIRDFKFVDEGRSSSGWSIGGDGKLVHWDLRMCKSIETLSLPDPNARTLCLCGPSVLCASHKAFLIDPENPGARKPFTASSNIVHSMKASLTRNSETSVPSFFLSAAERDRYINVFNIDANTFTGALVAENDVVAVAIPSDSTGKTTSTGGTPVTDHADRALAAINRDGILELFESPFLFGGQSTQRESESLKAKMKQRTRKAKALVKIIRPDKFATIVPLLDAVFQNHELVLAWAESGMDLAFDRVQWRKDDGTEIALEGIHEVVKAKGASTLGVIITNGVKDMGGTQVDESQTVVTTAGRSEDKGLASDGTEVISISSAQEDTDDYEDEELPERRSLSPSSDEDALPEPQSPKADVPSHDIDGEMQDVDMKKDDAVDEQAKAEEPSFGEMIRANAPGPVDVQAAFATSNVQAVIPASERPLQLPSGMSLGTVLTQALRTNDVKLLETCLHMREMATVRATIERLDSSLASTLIQKLAERFHSRPGRAGSLLVWIQWTVVAHGGYLASQPGAMKALAALHRVIGERARSLPLLLSLKGKLDMLEAQMNLRTSMLAQSKAANIADEDDHEGVIYVEGQEDSESDEGDADVEMASVDSDEATDGAKDGSESEESGEEDEEMPTMTNGALTESDDEGSESGSESLIDDEAESTDQDSDDEASIDEVDHEDVDSVGTDASSEADEAPPAKRPATTTLRNGLHTKKL
ncbi:MAG: hypothetical protein Q9201_001052 [Fulgogasparrea decipioides]